MRAIRREVNTPNFVPDFVAKSLMDIDFKTLRKQGVRFVAFDADSTLVNFRGKVLSNDTKLFLQKQRKYFDKWCIASNRITNDLLPLGESMDAPVIRASLFTRKPSRRFFNSVIKLFGAHPHEIAMIGDKLIADIYGGNKSGLVTVWVEKLGTDSIWDRWLHVRAIEKWITRRYL